MEKSNELSQNAELMLWNRKILKLQGIEDVISFDEISIYLVTKDGNFLIEGTELHITTLDVPSGDMTVEGNIRSMIYQDKESATKGGFFSKVFR